MSGNSANHLPPRLVSNALSGIGSSRNQTPAQDLKATRFLHSMDDEDAPRPSIKGKEREVVHPSASTSSSLSRGTAFDQRQPPSSQTQIRGSRSKPGQSPFNLGRNTLGSATEQSGGPSLWKRPSQPLGAGNAGRPKASEMWQNHPAVAGPLYTSAGDTSSSEYARVTAENTRSSGGSYLTDPLLTNSRSATATISAVLSRHGPSEPARVKIGTSHRHKPISLGETINVNSDEDVDDDPIGSFESDPPIASQAISKPVSPATPLPASLVHRRHAKSGRGAETTILQASPPSLAGQVSPYFPRSPQPSRDLSTVSAPSTAVSSDAASSASQPATGYVQNRIKQLDAIKPILLQTPTSGPTGRLHAMKGKDGHLLAGPPARTKPAATAKAIAQQQAPVQPRSDPFPRSPFGREGPPSRHLKFDIQSWWRGYDEDVPQMEVTMSRTSLEVSRKYKGAKTVMLDVPCHEIESIKFTHDSGTAERNEERPLVIVVGLVHDSKLIRPPEEEPDQPSRPLGNSLTFTLSPPALHLERIHEFFLLGEHTVDLRTEVTSITCLETKRILAILREESEEAAPASPPTKQAMTQTSIATSLRPRTTRSTAANPVVLDAEAEPPDSTKRTRKSRRPPISSPERTMAAWPPSGRPEITILRGDYHRLTDDDEFLNDTIVEWGLKSILGDLRARDPALADQVHLFNTYFHKKLTDKKKSQKGVEPWEAVKKWTAKVDLFEKKFIVVPINEDYHWYLAIVVNPAFILQPPPSPAKPMSPPNTRRKVLLDDKPASTFDVDSSSESSEPGPRKRPRVNADQMGLGRSAEGSRGPSTPRTTADEEIDSIEGDPVLPAASATLTSDLQSKEAASAGKEDDALRIEKGSQGLVLIMDSLGSTRQAPANLINDYLRCEARERKGYRELVSKLVGKKVDVPTQGDWSSCGVYLLHFAEIFFRDPQKVLDYVQSSANRPQKSVHLAEKEALWGSDAVLKGKRNELRSRLLGLEREWRLNGDRPGTPVGSFDDLPQRGSSLAQPSPAAGELIEGASSTASSSLEAQDQGAPLDQMASLGIDAPPSPSPNVTEGAWNGLPSLHPAVALPSTQASTLTDLGPTERSDFAQLSMATVQKAFSPSTDCQTLGRELPSSSGSETHPGTPHRLSPTIIEPSAISTLPCSPPQSPGVADAGAGQPSPSRAVGLKAGTSSKRSARSTSPEEALSGLHLKKRKRPQSPLPSSVLSARDGLPIRSSGAALTSPEDTADPIDAFVSSPAVTSSARVVINISSDDES